MRYLRIIVSIVFFISLSSSLTCAEDLYMWTDEEGVVHITDNPRALPPGGDVEKIRHTDRGAADGQAVPARETVTGEAQGDGADRKSPGEEVRQEDRGENLRQAREAYDRARELVEKRRREYSRKDTRHSRDRYRYALKELAERREKLRELERQK